MDINDIICTALKSLNMPVAQNRISKEILKELKADEYCIFDIYSEQPDVSADDGVVTEKSYIYVNIFTRKNANIFKKEAKRLLRAAGFGVTDSEILYDDKTGYSHIVIDCELTSEV